MAQNWTRVWLTILAALTLAGCATIASPPSEELITYETHPPPFCGKCDTIRVVAASDGRVRVERGHWAGLYRDWRIVRQDVRVTPEQFARFRETLAPYRPQDELRLNDQPPCKTFTPDLGEVSVSWRGRGADARMAFNRGCERETRSAMAQALQAAPSALGLQTPDW
jgi:hypothetical protein